MAKSKKNVEEVEVQEVEVQEVEVQEVEVQELEVQEVEDQEVEVQETTEKSIEEMNSLELRDYYEKEFNNKKEVISKLTENELIEMENVIMKLYDEQDQLISEKRYILPESVVFNFKRYSQKDIARLICKFIDKVEVDYSTSLGMYQLYKLWLNPTKDISYGEYDSTLRILGQSKFKGFNDWEGILVIVEYFKQCNDEYAKDTCKYQFLANWHNEVLKRMELVSGHNPEADGLEGVQTPAYAIQ